MKKQKCDHPFFYTIDEDVYCNECHKELGHFRQGKEGTEFVKTTKQTISDEDLNEMTVKTDVS